MIPWRAHLLSGSSCEMFFQLPDFSELLQNPICFPPFFSF